MSAARLGYAAALALGVACLVLLVALVLIRFLRDRAERRRRVVRAPVWREVLTLSSGEGMELEQAQARLLATTGAERRAIEADSFALLPKLRGEARDRLREVLRAWGIAQDPRHSTTSSSAVRRARGYYRLGALAEASGRDRLIGGLADRDFVARRTAVLALGSFPERTVVRQLLNCAVEEPRLRRDFLASIDRIGDAAVPELLAELSRALAELRGTPAGTAAWQGDLRRGHLAAEALGLVGAYEAVGRLEAALRDAPAELQVACINALGSLGSPSSVFALSQALDHEAPEVRRAAARALGMIGAGHAVELLTGALDDGDVEVARAVANALHRCGRHGRAVLGSSAAPVAREVLALAALGEAS
ncbi:MAG: HEAT repeat domain-containing protein [Nocardioides sp.]